MHLPHLSAFHRAPVVFLTACTLRREALLASPETHHALREVWEQSAPRNGWWVGQYVLMPDHLHLFACPGSEALPLARWVQLWKVIAAKRINRALQRNAPVWQADYFDRYMRSAKDYEEKWDYVAMNPVRRGLVNHPEAWPYRGVIHDLKHRAARD